METVKDITIAPCSIIHKESILVEVEPEGNLFCVQVRLENVCPCNYVTVGVLIFSRGCPYALQTKKIYTGNSSCCCHKVDIELDDFYFIFTDYIDPNDLDIKVIAHYVY